MIFIEFITGHLFVNREKKAQTNWKNKQIGKTNKLK